MAPVPVALCGKNPTLATSFVDLMSDQDYEVVHVWHDAATAKRELSALLEGRPTRPASGLGSNADSSRASRAPRAIIVGAGFSQSELDDMRSEPQADRIPWLYPKTVGQVSTVAQALTGKSFMQTVVDRARKTLRQNGLADEHGDVQPGVWSF